MVVVDLEVYFNDSLLICMYLLITANLLQIVEIS